MSDRTLYTRYGRHTVAVPRLRVGDAVSWEAYAGGAWRTYRGRVVAVLPAGTPWEAVQAQHRPGRTLSFAPPADPRDHRSYLVEVPAVGRALPRLYWPRVPALQRLAPVVGPRGASPERGSRP
jgi:hypothetical protein